jgi:hypothetical protein
MYIHIYVLSLSEQQLTMHIASKCPLYQILHHKQLSEQQVSKKVASKCHYILLYQILHQ